MTMHNATKEKIEKIFKNLNVKYEQNNKIPNDKLEKILNYKISFNTYGELKYLNIIGAILLWNEDFSLDFLVSNLYKIEDEDELLECFQIVNKANDHAYIGKFGVFNDEMIVYRSSSECGDGYVDLTEDLIKKHISAFSSNLLYLFNLIYEREEKKNG